MTLRTSLSLATVTVTRLPSGTIHLVIRDGQEIWLTPRDAASVLGALNGLPDVARAWLHGGVQ